MHFVHMWIKLLVSLHEPLLKFVFRLNLISFLFFLSFPFITFNGRMNLSLLFDRCAPFDRMNTGKCLNCVDINLFPPIKIKKNVWKYEMKLFPRQRKNVARLDLNAIFPYPHCFNWASLFSCALELFHTFSPFFSDLFHFFSFLYVFLSPQSNKRPKFVFPSTNQNVKKLK